MGRRALHDEGSELLRERLAERVAVDFNTARRLFTLSACCISGAERHGAAAVERAVRLQLQFDPLADGGGDAEAGCTAGASMSIRWACATAPVDPFAVAVMAEIGIDLAAPPAQDLRRARGHLVRSRRLAVARGAARGGRAHPHHGVRRRVLAGVRPDRRRRQPRGSCSTAYRMVRDHLRQRILERFPPG